MEQRDKKINSLWKTLLASALIKSEKKKASVLVLGNPKNGKNSLIESMIKFLGQQNTNDVHHDSLEKKENQNVYIMDYKFLKIKQFSEEEDSEEIGTINFYIVNDQISYLKSFLREQMFENLMIMLVLDISKPGDMTSEFIEWISYINDQMMPYIMDI